MNVIRFCSVSVAVIAYALLSMRVYSQVPPGGGMVIGPDGKPPYNLSDPTWSFEATTEWFQGSDEQVYRTEYVLRHPLQGTRIDVWDRPGNGAVHAKANRRADRIYFYTPQLSGFVWESTRSKPDVVLRPTRISCLNALLQEARTTSKSAVTTKYSLPSYVNLDEPWDIFGEAHIGANQGKHQAVLPPHLRHIKTSPPRWFGPNFQVNRFHSGFGWPPLMFSLNVFDKDFLKLDGSTYQKTGEGTIAGVKCERYVMELKNGRSVIGKSTYWVEPKTRLVLRLETTRRFPGSRMPPITSGYRTVRFRLLKSVPAGAFNLPIGVAVELPKSLYQMPLPAYIKRRPLKGYDAVVGFPLKPYPSDGSASKN